MQNWWNPFSRRGVRNSNATVGSVYSPQHGSTDIANLSPSSVATDNAPGINDEDHPRRIQERKDVTLLLLAVTFRKLLMEEQKSSSVASSSSLSPVTSDSKREELIDRAFEIIQDEIEVDTLSITKLRQVLQLELEIYVKDILKAFKDVDLNLTLIPNQTDKNFKKDRDETNKFYNRILRKELEHTTSLLDQWKDQGHHQNHLLKAPKGADPTQFLLLKLGALQTLLDKRTNSDNSTSQTKENEQQEEEEEEGQSPSSSSWVDADEFGFHESPTDPRRNELIRHYQTINICRNRELRNVLGYSTLALQSSIPGAGRGVYVDGYAPAGSILCFQPGLVWLKDHLLNMSIEEDREMTRNDAYQMSLRPDDIIIDSRQSPYTVLTDDSSNMMAVGHIVNHPTTTKLPNCRSAMFDFTSNLFRDDDDDRSNRNDDVRRYIPNTYAKPPINSSSKNGLIQSLMKGRNVYGSGSTDDGDIGVVEMPSMVLIATRDICNEEIFYDYRLATSHVPSWYEPVVDLAYSEGGGDEDDEGGQDEESKEDKK